MGANLGCIGEGGKAGVGGKGSLSKGFTPGENVKLAEVFELLEGTNGRRRFSSHRNQF